MIDYEVWLKPGLAALAGLVVLVKALRGFSHEDGYDFGALRSAGLIALAAATLLSTIVITPPGSRGVIYSHVGGVIDRERVEGVSFIVPYVQTAHQVNVRTQKFFTQEAFAQSFDLQEITVHVSVNYRIDPTRAAELFRQVGQTYTETIVAPAVFQRVKEAVGQVFAEDFAAQREQLAATVQDRLAAQLQTYGITVDYVNIEDAVFDPKFINAVQDKVVADQEAAEQERLIAAEAAKKEQVILQAEAQAQKIAIEAAAQKEAIEDIASALGFTPVEYLRYQLLARWDGILPTTLVGDSDPVSLLLEVK
jgi:regulator of protease activity HflC (stomatin/prohibitin superfamily)